MPEPLTREVAVEVVDEIALNPRTFIDRTDREIVSTLVREMVHLWQFHFGKPGRRGYHNKQWATKMEEIGPCRRTLANRVESAPASR
jgi:predicted SprT family Zn-dependent metalloprotease